MGHGDRSEFDFREVADVGEAFKIVVLGPESGVVSEGDGVDEGIGEGQLVFDEQIGSGDGDGLVDGDDDARAHGLGYFVSFRHGALLEGDFADFREDDAGDDESGQLEENGAEVNGVGTIFETFVFKYG